MLKLLGYDETKSKRSLTKSTRLKNKPQKTYVLDQDNLSDLQKLFNKEEHSSLRSYEEDVMKWLELNKNKTIAYLSYKNYYYLWINSSLIRRKIKKSLSGQIFMLLDDIIEVFKLENFIKITFCFKKQENNIIEVIINEIVSTKEYHVND